METTVEHSDGWVFYDDSCHMCRSTVARFAPLLRTRGFEALPLQHPVAQRRLNARPDELLREMKVVTPQGEVLGGAEAIAHLARQFWWGLPLYWLSRLPWMAAVLSAAYAWVAARRHCLGGACSIPSAKPWTTKRIIVAAAPLLFLPLALAVLFRSAAPWVLMWAVAGGLWWGLKWIALMDAWRAGLRPACIRALGYFFASPNMDAITFFDQRRIPPEPARREWLSALTNTSIGLLVLYTGVNLIYPISTLLSGWVGMTGLVLVLHFGLFKLVTLAWRHSGVDTTLLMHCPIASRSLADFWGRRWNTGFSGSARRFVHKPLSPRIGPAAATAVVFLISGVVHELVISVPAGGGYGLATAYFLIQAAGVQFERSTLGNRFGLGHGLRGWTFALLLAAAPAFLLFHPPFVHGVILPFMSAIGALKGGSV